MNKMLGVDINLTPSTTQQHELGMIVDDVRGGEQDLTYTYYLNGVLTAVTVRKKYAPGARFKYVKFNGTVAAGDSVKLDTSVAAGLRDATVIQSAAVDEISEGLAVAAASAGMFGFIQIKGRFFDANVATAANVGEIVMPSATAGRLAKATPSATNALAAATGCSFVVVASIGTNLKDVDIR